MKVIGIQSSSFDTKDGKHISGKFLFLSEERSNVIGVATERIFLTDDKLSGYSPALGDDIKPYYNRFGKVDFVELL